MGSLKFTSKPRPRSSLLVLLGQVLELRARSRTGSAIRALLDLSPKLARIMRDDGSEYDVAARSGQGWRQAARSPWREDSR